MTDATKNEPLRVKPVSTGGALLGLPASQLDQVRQLLDRHSVRYWVSEQLISYDGGPYQALIKFPRGTDAKAVQAILDSLP